MRVRSCTFLGEETWTTYPHTNGFVHGGRELVCMQMRGGSREMFRLDLATGARSTLGDFEPFRECRAGSWDVAFDAGNRLAIVLGNRACVLDLNDPREFQCVYQAREGAGLDSLCSLSRDGRKLLCREVDGEISRALEIDVESGAVRELFSKTWYANHFHFCPHDENWVAFSHEGPTDQIPDRCWVWHAEHAPQGRVAFDQVSEVPGKLLCVGHERWGFHDVSAYVIAYAHSPAGNRGLYEIFADGRPARLLWESDVLWHCTMDPTGRFVAVDTTGPFREEPLSEEAFRKYLECHLQTDRERGTMDSDVVVLDLKSRESLYMGTARRSSHPYHPHPAISPDRKWVVWNDCNPKGVWVASLEIENGN